MPTQDPKNILFFDGVCNLCNSTVDFLMRHQGESCHFFFASLQGETAAKVLPQAMIEDLNSVVYYKSGSLYSESSAVLHALVDLGGWWKAMGIFLIVPSFLRNSAYRLVANNRYRWFGKRQTCRIPTSREKMFFLD